MPEEMLVNPCSRIHYHAPWGANWNDKTPTYTENAVCQKPPRRKSSCSKNTEVDSSAGLALN